MSAESPTGTPISQETDDGDEAQVRRFIEDASKKAAAETPGIDPDAIVAKVLEGLTPQLNSLVDKRVGGFQQALAENQRVIEDQASKLREYEAAGLSEDERAALAQKERDEEMEQIRLERDILLLKEKFPKGAEAYQRLISDEHVTAEQQIALLDQLLSAQGVQTAPAAPAAPAAPEVPVDHNNPQRTLSPDAEVTDDGQVMSEEIAMATLRATPRWPGIDG